jgi:hypothetical protein
MGKMRKRGGSSNRKLLEMALEDMDNGRTGMTIEVNSTLLYARMWGVGWGRRMREGGGWSEVGRMREGGRRGEREGRREERGERGREERGERDGSQSCSTS